MPLHLDHVVIAVNDLAQAMADYQALGFTVLVGGEHTGRQSHNALVVFEDGSYLELIAWRGANDESWWRLLQAHGEGFVDFALLPQAIEADVAAAQARGLDTLRPVIEGGRFRPDGVQLVWRLARQTSRALPFLCGDVTPRALRVPEGSAERQHANGVRGIAAVVVAVADLDADARRCAALVGAEPASAALAQAAAPSGWPAAPGVRSLGVALPAAALVLVSPEPGANGAAAAALRERLSGRGPGPCALVFRGPHPAQAGAIGQRLDPALSHGATLFTDGTTGP